MHVDLGIRTTWQCTSFAISLKELNQLSLQNWPTAFPMQYSPGSNLPSSKTQRKARQAQLHSCKGHLVRSEHVSARNTLDCLRTCDKKPTDSQQRLRFISLLTPSSRNTVESLQSALCFVNELHKWVMNRDRTSLSVLHVVRDTQTSPSDDIAAMMLIF